MKLHLVIVSILAASNIEAKYYGPTNPAGVKLIEEFEGFRANFNLNSVGLRAIGYGHSCHLYSCNVPIRGKYKVPLTKTTGEALLKEDLKSHEICVNSAVSYAKLTANQFSALTSFVFNLGCGSLRSSALLRKLNSGDVAGASNEFKKSVYSGGRYFQAWVRRREAERKLFCNGVSCVGTSQACTGRSMSGSVIIRTAANNGAARVGSIPPGATVPITGRIAGVYVNGNRFWFKVSKGYVPAYNMVIAFNNGAPWCNKWY